MLLHYDNNYDITHCADTAIHNSDNSSATHRDTCCVVYLSDAMCCGSLTSRNDVPGPSASHSGASSLALVDALLAETFCVEVSLIEALCVETLRIEAPHIDHSQAPLASAAYH